jgi:hypothetical protein
VGGIFIAILSTTTTTTTDGTSEEVIAIPETVTTVLEGMVGIFMIALGSYGLYRASRRRKRNQDNNTSNDTSNNNNDNNTTTSENHPETIGGSQIDDVDAEIRTGIIASHMPHMTTNPREAIVLMEDSNRTAIIRTRRGDTANNHDNTDNDNYDNYDEEDPYRAMDAHDTEDDTTPMSSSAATGPTPMGSSTPS